MRSLVFLFSCLVVGLHGSQFFEPGLEYVYMMETSINTGTGDLSPHMSGFTVKGELRVQAEEDTLNIQIINLRQSYFNGPYAPGYWPYQNMDARTRYIPVKEEYMEAIFSVSYENGKVKEITFADDTPLWLKNLMRGFASSFQIDMENIESGERAWYSAESTVHGDCNVQYTYENSPNSEYHVVTKAVSHISDCINRSYKMFNSFYGKTCRNKRVFTPRMFSKLESEETMVDYISKLNQQYQSPEPMYSDSTTTIFMRPNEDGVYTVEKFFTAGAVMAHPFGKKGASKWTLANRTFILKSVGPSTRNITVEGSTYEGVAFEWEENDRSWDTDVDLKKKESFFRNGYTLDEEQDIIWNNLYQKIFDFVEEQKNHKTNYETKEDRDELHSSGIHRLLTWFFPLDYDSLSSLKEKIFNDDSYDGLVAKEIFMELLPMTGTLPSASLVFDMVMNSEYRDEKDLAKALTSVPFHIRKPNKNLVEQWEGLLENEFAGGKFSQMAAYMSFSHLVRRTCELAAPQSYQKVDNDNNRFAQRKTECLEELLNPMIEKYFEEFLTIEKDQMNELNKYISMFANFKWGKASELLFPIINGEDEESYPVSVRVNAMFAVYENVIENGEEIQYFLPLVLNTVEDPEIRITAFKYLMKGNPDASTFVKIFTNMLHEPCFEVFNYIYTSFEKMAYSWDIEPCCKNQQKFARYYLKYWKEYMWVRPKYAFGMSKTFSRTFAQEKYGYSGSLEYSTIGHPDSPTPHVYEVEARSQQFEGHTMQLFGIKIRVKGLAEKIHKKFLEMYFENRSFDDLRDILFEQMGMQERRKKEFRFELTVSLKDTQIFQQSFNEDSFVEFFEYLTSFRENFSFKRQLAFTMGSVLYEQPSDIGFPVAYYAGMTSTLNVNLNVNKGENANYVSDDENSLFFRILNYKLSYNGQVMSGMRVFHQDKTSFSITQDNVYKHQASQWTKVAFNKPKKNLRIVFERPDYRKPASFVMHSQTSVTITTNKLGDVPTDLVKTCPTCQNELVLTRGDDHKTGRYFINQDSEEWGARIAGKYFDCELPEASSQGEMFKILSEAFFQNKEPKDPITTLVMGFQQINAFLTFFPKVESCGLNFIWSQSKYHPVTQTEISLTGNIQDMQNGRRYSLSGDIDLQGDVERSHHIAINYEYENTRPDIPMLYDLFNKHSFNVKAGRKAFEVGSTDFPEYAICLKFDQTYPVDNDKFFSLELNRPQKVTYEGAVSFGFDSSCSNHDQKIVMKTKAATMKDAKRYLKNKWYYNTCMEEKKSAKYRSSRSFPLTDACFYTAEDLYTLRKFKTDVTTNNIPKWIVKMFRRMEVIMKTKLWPYWKVDLKRQISSIDYDNYSPWVRTDLVFDPLSGTADFLWMTDIENSEFKGMKYKEVMKYGNTVEDYLPSSKFSPVMKSLHGHDLLNYCTVSNDQVRTYDNVTYDYMMHDCWTLIYADCSEQPEAAVFIKKNQANKISMRILIGSHTIEIQPAGYSSYELTVDGEEVELDDQESFLFPSQEKVYSEPTDDYHFRVHKWDNSFTVDIPFFSSVHYDGYQIMVVSTSFVMGRHCGMCGDFNRNKSFELMGDKNCLVKNGNEMAASYAWSDSEDDSCPEKPECLERDYSTSFFSK